MTELLDAPSLGAFADQEDTTFTVEREDADAVGLRLTEVAAHEDTDDWERFSLWFQAESDTILSQDCHRLTHPQLDAFDLTMSPVTTASDPETPAYQAVFDRPAADASSASDGGRGGIERSSPVTGTPGDTFIGSITMFGGKFGITGYHMCDGTLVPITQHQALYSLLGTTYGGNGRTTFGLPDLRGRVPIHKGYARWGESYRWGQWGGTPSTTLLPDQLPPHTHGGDGLELPVSMATGTENSPDGHKLAKFPAGGIGDKQVYNDKRGNGSMAVSGTTAATGEGAEISNMQPYLAINYQICLQGPYPSRNNNHS